MQRVNIAWGQGTENYSVSIKVRAADRSNLLADILSAMTSEKVGVNSTNAKLNPDGSVSCFFNVNIKNLGQLEKLIKKVERVQSVLRVERA